MEEKNIGKIRNENDFVVNIVSSYIFDRVDDKNIKKWFNVMNKYQIISKINVGKIKDLYNKYDTITRENGIYFVVTKNGIKEEYIKEYNCLTNKDYAKRFLYKKEKLIRKFRTSQIEGYQEIIYIGKAEEKKGLSGRIKKYIEFGYGKCVNHAGGRAIWQVDGCSDFYIVWLECNNNMSHIAEKSLIELYSKENLKKNKGRIYPFANWRK